MIKKIYLIFAGILLIIIGCDLKDNSSAPDDNADPDQNEEPTGGYTMEIDSTGEFHLIVFQSSISSLGTGDEIGVFDISGITNFNDCSNQIGEVLVGTAQWSGDQVEISAVGSLDFCEFSGIQLPGYIKDNSIVVRIWDQSEQMEFETELTFSAGPGYFLGLITAISEITLK